MKDLREELERIYYSIGTWGFDDFVGEVTALIHQEVREAQLEELTWAAKEWATSYTREQLPDPHIDDFADLLEERLDQLKNTINKGKA